MSKLYKFIEKIRIETGLLEEIPTFDPRYGDETSEILFLLEAPGRKAVESGLISLENNDQTARNMKAQLSESGLNLKNIILWNIVPWYLGNTKKISAANVSDIRAALSYLGKLITLLTELKYIVLVGGAARIAHVYLSYSTNVTILSCHHPSPKVVNKYPEKVQENLKIFKKLAKS